MNNLTYIWNNFLEWSTQGYTEIVGFFFWPIIFSVVIGYAYLATRSVVVAAIAMLIVFGAFGGTGIFLRVDMWVMTMQAIFALIMTGLVVIFLTKWRK